jgi:hypothetical protein
MPYFNHRTVRIAAVRPLGLDHDERDTVDIAHHIGPPRPGAVAGDKLKLFGDEEAVILWHGHAMLFAIDKFGDCQPESQRVVEPFIRSQQPLVHWRRREFAHDLVNRIGGERKAMPFIVKPPPLEFVDQDGTQQHPVVASAHLHARRRGEIVPS